MQYRSSRFYQVLLCLSLSFLQLHCKKASSSSSEPAAPTDGSACAQGLAGITFPDSSLPLVAPHTMSTQNAELQLTGESGSAYKPLQLNCDMDEDADVIRWKACSQSNVAAGCYPTDQEWSISLGCGALPSLQQFEGQVVQFTVQSCVSQQRDAILHQNNQTIDPNSLSCEAGKTFIFKLPTNFSSNNGKYASILDELYTLQTQFVAVGQQMFNASVPLAKAPASVPDVTSPLALAGGTSSSAGPADPALVSKSTEYLNSMAKTFAGIGPYQLALAAANSDALAEEADDLATSDPDSTELALATTDSLAACGGALGTQTKTNAGTNTKPISQTATNPATHSNPSLDTTNQTSFVGSDSCHEDQSWDNASSACILRCASDSGTIWDQAQGICVSTATEVVESGGGPNAATRGGTIFAGTLMAVLGVAILFGGPQKLLHKYRINNTKLAFKKLVLLSATLPADLVNVGDLTKIKEVRTALGPERVAALKKAPGSYTPGDLAKAQEAVAKATPTDPITPEKRVDAMQKVVKAAPLTKAERQKFADIFAGPAPVGDVAEKTQPGTKGGESSMRAKATNATNNFFKKAGEPGARVKNTGGTAMKWVGGILALGGIIIAVLGSLNVFGLAGDTSNGLSGYAQAMGSVDATLDEINTQIALRSGVLDSLLAQDNAAAAAKH